MQNGSNNRENLLFHILEKPEAGFSGSLLLQFKWYHQEHNFLQSIHPLSFINGGSIGHNSSSCFTKYQNASPVVLDGMSSTCQPEKKDWFFNSQRREMLLFPESQEIYPINSLSMIRLYSHPWATPKWTNQSIHLELGVGQSPPHHRTRMRKIDVLPPKLVQKN